MCVLFFSDIHGSAGCLEEFSRWVEYYRPQQLVLLGDVLSPGGNNMGGEYDPQRVADILNAWKDRIMAVRGNCDRTEDQLLLEFPLLAEYATLRLDNRKFFLSHGHLWHPGHLPPLGSAEVLASGHTHIPQISTAEGICCFNPGSLSMPRGGFPPSFALYQQNRIAVLELQTGTEMFTHSLTEG
ncbi:MAG: phosphodiesterase [Oligosphaeraceae bacterium]|nr:phosphodiesterase [Oligosphaeraceae bacterium]